MTKRKQYANMKDTGKSTVLLYSDTIVITTDRRNKMKDYFDLKGQVAIVTGCSTGLGVQMAKALANQGAAIVAVARRQNMIDAVAKEIADEFGVKTLAVRCDITDTAAVEDMVDTVLKEFGRIDILINNAGTGAVAPAEDITDEQFGNEMNIDLFGSFRVARAAAKKAMIPAKYGRIINIASMYGRIASHHNPILAYNATKGAVPNFTRGLAQEWAEHGITVNAIGPGMFPSEMMAVDEGTEQFLAFRAPIGRSGKVHELCGQLLLFASDMSSYTTGQTIYIDGGLTSV